MGEKYQAIFLVSYVISKLSNAPIPFGGQGLLRPGLDLSGLSRT